MTSMVLIGTKLDYLDRLAIIAKLDMTQALRDKLIDRMAGVCDSIERDLGMVSVNINIDGEKIADAVKGVVKETFPRGPVNSTLPLIERN